MMAQDLRFFDRLYQGFEAEYLVTSALFGAGLEAFKLPGDYGFDLLVSDQWRSTRSRTVAEPLCDTRMPFPYVLQVKSRRAQLSDIRLVEGVERRELEMKFSLKQHEYDLLVADERSFLVCVLFMPPDQRTVSVRPLTFWLTGAQLRNMHEREYLIASIDDRGQPWLTLNVVYRFVPMIRRETLAQQLLEAWHPVKAHVPEDSALQNAYDESVAAFRARVARMLPDVVESGRAGAEYIAFRRREWDKEAGRFCEELTTPRMLESRQADLARIGLAPSDFPIDDTGIEHWLRVQKAVSKPNSAR
ncbi:hypothetical protein MXL91_25585 [Achromobacter ruhlandii]|uniref:hypothetical protein n=1 Tax=Achromobacter ruhlandii TaxID=72557 RepID=UPI000C265E73|nr:hypothetical protein [Achromobacter ruhlandii]MEB6664849.1 hypothetical protein [Achromobacter ruhlandii]PJM86297.1 hypothetical protein CV044_25225 [Achromobacter ruhlandii]